MRPQIIDTFPMHDELDMLECRLTELYESVDWFVIVEADVTHQDNPKPYYYWENQERYAAWADKIIPVRATGLPTVHDDPDPWARELAQRGHTAEGLARIGVTADDVVLHSDIDEIPRGIHARNVRPRPGRFITFQQRLHCFAVDWQHPDWWFGTIAATAATIKDLGDNVNAFARLRDKRNRWVEPASRVDPSPLLEAGWHLSWMGGRDAAFHKLGAFCHPEVRDRIESGLSGDLYFTEGVHVDGRKMAPVDVDASWPKWIAEGHAPASWFRPR